MKEYEHPPVEELNLTKVMQALVDPCRQQIVHTLLEKRHIQLACCEFGLTVSKATASHHFEILLKAGLIQKKLEGTKSLISLREADVEARFPGLLKLIETEISAE
ncbi:MAG: helix-turn-helix domain-containing protein [Opitutales bacterium]|nr:helix-turn-helix domain-containing protein [Opitutales bacterium]